MASRVMYWLCAGLCLSALTAAQADTPTASVSKPAAVLYINDGSAPSLSRAAIIKQTIAQARRDFGITIDEYVLADEKDMARQIDTIADNDVGMIAIMEPHDIDALSTIPGLYPDIGFSVIGIAAPLYLTNVHSDVLRDAEGMYISGTLAALHSPHNTIAFVSSDDTPASRNFAYAFAQGAKYITPGIHIVQKMGDKITADTSKADVIFVLDDSPLGQSLNDARAHKHVVISASRDITDAYPGLVLTSLVRHNDRALYTDLKNYSAGRWKPGNRSMGLGEGVIDYVVDDSNKALLNRQMVDQVERIRDLIAQGLIKIVPLP